MVSGTIRYVGKWVCGSIPTIPTDLVGILLIMNFIINIVEIEIHYQQAIDIEIHYQYGPNPY